MANFANIVLANALKLSTVERVNIAEQLLVGLDNVDENIDKIWGKEADFRFDEYQKGNIESLPATKIFAKYKNENNFS